MSCLKILFLLMIIADQTKKNAGLSIKTGNNADHRCHNKIWRIIKNLSLHTLNETDIKLGVGPLKYVGFLHCVIYFTMIEGSIQPVAPKSPISAGGNKIWLLPLMIDQSNRYWSSNCIIFYRPKNIHFEVIQTWILKNENAEID